MKQLTKEDLDFIKWRIWEPLRRKIDYRKDCEQLKKSHPDLDLQESFCKRWRLPYPVDHSLSFDQLLTPHKDETKKQAIRRVQGLFLDLYQPQGDSAAFVNLRDCLQGQYLRVYIDLKKSRNQIEAEIKKILDEWLSGERLNFHGIQKDKSERLHGDVWKVRFMVFDLVEEKFTPFPQISLSLKTPIDTIYKQYKAAWEAVNPGEEFPAKRQRDKMLDSGSLASLFPCNSCSERKECKKACARAEDFQKRYTDYSQDHLLIDYMDNFLDKRYKAMRKKQKPMH
jgi:hypothetical protein